MARSRIIKPEFWNDEKISKISREARLLFIGMWSTSDDYGVTKGHPIWLKSQIFPYDEDVKIEQFKEWLKEIESINAIIPFQSHNESYYFIRSFSCHQKIDKPSKNKNPDPPSNFPKSSETFPKSSETFPKSSETFPKSSETFPKSSETLGNKFRKSEIFGDETETETEDKQKINRNILSEKSKNNFSDEQTFSSFGENSEKKKCIKEEEVNLDALPNIQNSLNANPPDSQMSDEKFLFNFWNSLDIIKHRELSKYRPCLTAKLKAFSQEEILQAMQNYHDVLVSPLHFLKYKWSLNDFLSRKNAFENFLNVNKPFENYKKFEDTNRFKKGYTHEEAMAEGLRMDKEEEEKKKNG